jgi:hypothetical protein
MRRDYCVIAWILLSKSLAFGANLPSPTGHFPVGRVTVTYRDDTRIEPLDPNPKPLPMLEAKHNG